MPSDNALIVTSSPARAATADNVAQLQTATSNIGAAFAPGNEPTNLSTPQDSAYKGVEKAFAPALPADPGAGADGIPRNTGTPTDTGAGGGTSGTGGGAGATDPYRDALGGVTDPALKEQYSTALDGLDQGIANECATLKSAQATAANDPLAGAAIAQIQAKYGDLITQMKEKNRQLLGSYTTQGFRNGSAAYATQMNDAFLGDEAARADKRVSDLVQAEQNAILKANLAYQSQDAKALNAAMTQYQNANKAKLTALNSLLSAVNKQVSQGQAQQRIDLATKKQTVTLDIQKSNNLGTAIAKNIAAAGLKGDQLTQYIQQAAQEYGITNPEILMSAVNKAQQAQTKFDLSIANTKSIIQKRNNTPVKSPAAKGGGTDGGYKYTADDIAKYTSLLNEGGKGPNGTTYAGRGGSDEFVDPGAYVAAMQDWVGQNGTPAGFAKKFPVKDHVNPASYDLLPEAIRPKVKGASTPQYKTN